MTTSELKSSPPFKPNSSQGDEEVWHKIMHESAAVIEPPSSDLFNRIQEAIGDPEPQKRAVSLASWFSGLRALLGRADVAWAMAGLQAAAIVLLLVFWPSPRYETLSAPGSDAQIRLHILVDQWARFGDVQEILNEFQLQIIAGPNRDGLYTVVAPAGDSAEQLKNELKKHRQIIFVEQAY